MRIKLWTRDHQALLRRDLYAFIQQCFYELNPTATFLPNWHIQVIASELEACRRGGQTRLSICEPPRSLKSHCASVAFVAFLLGHDPSAKIICVSYGQELANKHAMDCRRILSSRWYRALFPNTRLSSERQALQEFVTTEQGFRLSTSVGGVLTGRGADYIIVDDALKPEEALSDARRKAVNDWFDATLYSRLNNKRDGRIILIAQRLHEDDLIGHALAKEPWKVVRFPAIAEEDEVHVIETPYGTRRFKRRAGEALHAKREPLKVLNHMRDVQGEYIFSAQYQQRPSPLGGGSVKTEWFKTYTLADIPDKFEMIIQSWDSANKPTELNNFSVCTTWAMKNKHIYLLHVFRKRLGYPDLKRAVREQASAFNPQTILIEDKASGTQLIQDLVDEGMHEIKKYEPLLDKITRMNTVTSIIENGFVHLPDQAAWLGDYLLEMASFPKGKYDDQVDSSSQALAWIKDGADAYVLGVVDCGRKLGLPFPLPVAAAATAQFSRASNQTIHSATSNPGALGPCPECGATCVATCAGQIRCNQCGHSWWPNGRIPKVFRVTRGEVLAGRVEWMRRYF